MNTIEFVILFIGLLLAGTIYYLIKSVRERYEEDMAYIKEDEFVRFGATINNLTNAYIHLDNLANSLLSETPPKEGRDKIDRLKGEISESRSSLEFANSLYKENLGRIPGTVSKIESIIEKEQHRLNIIRNNAIFQRDKAAPSYPEVARPDYPEDLDDLPL